MFGPGLPILSVFAACVIWGLSPLYYKLLDHVPAPEVMAHRTLWSFVLFAAVLAMMLDPTACIRELRTYCGCLRWEMNLHPALAKRAKSHQIFQ